VLLLLFELDRQRYALDAAQVSEVLPLVDIRALPGAPPGVAGVIEYRGATVPVLDSSALALGRRSARRFSTRIVIVQHTEAGGRQRALGLMLEGATSTLRCDADLFQPSGINQAGARYLGPIARLSIGLVQRVELGELLTPELCEVLFEAAEA
jgi:chemotaxis-related protein WspB